MIDYLPYNATENLEPVYTTLKGWATDLTQINHPEQFPVELKDYIQFVSTSVGIPVTIVSVGPDRTQTISMR